MLKFELKYREHGGDREVIDLLKKGSKTRREIKAALNLSSDKAKTILNHLKFYGIVSEVVEKNIPKWKLTK
jgi:DNA-binding CsgD family transcriptional regulator